MENIREKIRVCIWGKIKNDMWDSVWVNVKVKDRNRIEHNIRTKINNNIFYSTCNNIDRIKQLNGKY